MFYRSQVDQVETKAMVVTIEKGQIDGMYPPQTTCVESWYEGMPQNDPVNLSRVTKFRKDFKEGKVTSRSRDFPLLPNAIYPCIKFYADNGLIATWCYPPTEEGETMRNTDYGFLCANVCKRCG